MALGPRTVGDEDMTLPDFGLAGHTALVTGAGRGLGAGIAEALAAAGADLVLLSRSRDELEAVASRVRERGRAASVLACDVTDEAGVRGAIAALPALDILVNNAGTNIPQPFLDADSAALDTMLGLNVRAAFVVAQAATRRMLDDGDRERRGGSVVNISSTLGRVASRGRSVYAMTKHAIEGLTRAMAIELAPRGIRVNAVGPTWVETPMTAPALADPDFRAEVLGQIPMGRLARVGDVTGAVVFLASPAAAMITGASLVVDGGWTAR
jgi:NAD(P)-dependent dehydrogenase (short-subunit alcohol dehydrogenase family)